MSVRHIMLPDTLGVMSPSEVSVALGDMCSRFDESDFDFHPHNDYGLATANAMAAVESGAAAIHATLNCLGERAGNVSLAEVSVVLRDKLKVKVSVDETKIHDLSEMVEKLFRQARGCKCANYWDGRFHPNKWNSCRWRSEGAPLSNRFKSRSV